MLACIYAEASIHIRTRIDTGVNTHAHMCRDVGIHRHTHTHIHADVSTHLDARIVCIRVMSAHRCLYFVLISHEEYSVFLGY